MKNNPFILTLSDKQQAALAQFKSLLQANGAYVPPGQRGVPASVDDLMLVRFLKARRWEPPAALQQFLATVAWRQEHGVDKLYREEVDPEEYEQWKQTYPKWTGRRDNHGNPLYVYKLAVLTSAALKELNKVPEAVRYRRIVALYELLHNLAFPMCLSVPIPPPLLPPGEELSHAPAAPAPLPPNSIRLIQNTTIIDFSGTSLGSMFSFRHHLAQASGLAQANHPETLGSIFVVGAPGWWSTVWGWIRNWFDEQTRAKVHIVPAGSPELLEFIPKENLPRAYGGELDWVYEDDPSWDADVAWHLREVGAPEVEGVSSLRGPVIVTPRTEERAIRVELVGKGRHEVLVPPQAAPVEDAGKEVLPPSTSTLPPSEIPVAPQAEEVPLTPGGPLTPAANLAPLPSDPSSTAAAPASASPSTAQNGFPHEHPQTTADSKGGFLPAPIGPGLGPATPGTPGFVPNLTGGILGTPRGEGGAEGLADGEGEGQAVNELAERVGAVQV
ncbi:CRAL/TRIO domain-containing protein [Calocera cornea HHB12733]|uniref:CRAL/TRIO domain-containing protein n=1 Tax=Calocera cornea HHB12733 TaxID=1353952 RepID=A0A165HNT8_9BASI|nr:CRAL/TRIO domain-containing protein [Calocera cornea HHB12733]